MNEPNSDQVFDSLLEEMLTQQHPPNLTARIVTAWRREKSQQLQAAAEAETHALAVVKAVPIAAGPTEGSRNRAAARSDLPDAASHDKATHATGSGVYPTSQNWSRGRTAVALALSATLLLAVLGWIASQESEQAQTVQATEHSEVEVAAGNLPPGTGSLAGVSTLAPSGNSPKRPLGEVLELDDLPFTAERAITPSVANKAESEAYTPQRLTSEQVIAGLDGRLSQMWSNLGIEPNAVYNDAALAQRMSETLTGEPLAETWLNNFDEKNEKLDKATLTGEAIESMTFARNWARQFSELWLSRSSVSADSESAEVLRQAVVRRIHESQPWSGVIVDLLGGELTDSNTVSPVPLRPNAVFIAALAGGENHRLVDRLGTSFLDANLACVRCHDAATKAGRDTENQETYWSLVALLKGVDARGSAQGGMLVEDHQAELFAGAKSPTVFFDLPNGVLRAAEARFPGGQAWEMTGQTAPRQALAEWIRDSHALDRAAVNQVWKVVFGRLLVPQVLELERVGISERVETLQFLADQFRAHDHDLKQLVAWVVNSRAFAVQPNQLTQSQWLEASEGKLEDLQLAELAFAAGPSLGRSPESHSLENSLAAVVAWNSPHASAVTLAQPAPVSPANSSAASWKSTLIMPAMSYVIHGGRHTISQQTYVNKLLRADRLSWEERVQHIVGLGGNYEASPRVQQLSKELLEQNSGDAKAALLHLLWAVQNADANQ